MNLFGIVFYIIIIAVFINAKKAAQSEKGQKQASYKGKEKGNRNITENKASGNYSGQKTLTSHVPEKKATAIPNVPVKKKKESVYMAPHREEVRQPKIRTNNLWGEDEHAKQRIVALRLMEGDPVPQGYVKIRCPYCAADNLVTKNCKQYHSCYFCRVPID